VSWYGLTGSGTATLPIGNPKITAKALHLRCEADLGLFDHEALSFWCAKGDGDALGAHLGVVDEGRVYPVELWGAGPGCWLAEGPCPAGVPRQREGQPKGCQTSGQGAMHRNSFLRVAARLTPPPADAHRRAVWPDAAPPLRSLCGPGMVGPTGGSLGV